MLAFAFNTAGAVADLWMIAVILQTPRTALFEDTDEPAMIAWPGPGTAPPKRVPRGLDPRGGASVLVWFSLATVLFAASFLVIGIAEIVLARASPHGILAVGSLVIATISTTGGHTSGSANLSVQTLLAALMAAPLTWAVRRRARHRS